MSDSGNGDAVSIDVQFGAIRFVRETSGTFAVAAVDVSVMDLSGGAEIENLVQMEIKFPARPEQDTILQIVDTSRRLLAERLRAAASVIETQSTEALLFGEAP